MIERFAGMTMRKNILFSISSLGLGHATRTLAVIRAYLPTHEVHVISAGYTLHFLRGELEGARVTFYECKDYPPLERGAGWKFYWYLLIDVLATVVTIGREQAFVKALANRIDIECIIADGRYGSYLSAVPSFLISHQISFVMPCGLSMFQRFADLLNYISFKKFDALLIPDYADDEYNLAGALSHHPMLRRLNHHYIGVLSSITPLEMPEDIDILFSTGGFLSEHKPTFVNKLIEGAKAVPGKKVFILGKVHDHGRQIEIYSSVQGKERQELFNRAKFVVTRGGYTTIMDLIELGKHGLLFPTPGQTEQEYLAELHGRKKHFFASSPEKVDVRRANEERNTLTLFHPPWKTAGSVKKIRAIVEEATRPNFFSIIIPAHNEEGYIEETLQHIKNLDYPLNAFEALIIENGSSDRTEEIARRFEGGNVRVYQSPRGVSKAKNFGLDRISEKSDWVVFLDADTELGRPFLRDLDRYLRRYKAQNFSVGTTAVKPLENKSVKARAWFWFYNFGHKITGTSFAIQLMRAPLRKHVRFDEAIHFAEDLKFIKELLQFGKFLYFPTETVGTSTRRFDAVGWFRLYVRWTWKALVLSKTEKKTTHYHVIR